MTCTNCGGEGKHEAWRPGYHGDWEMAVEVDCEECSGSGVKACCACGEPSKAEHDAEGFAHCSVACRDENLGRS